MSLALLGVGGVLLVSPGVARRWLRRLPPRDWASLVTAALLGGIIAVEAGLVTLAIPTALDAIGWSGLARACERMFGSLALGGPLAGWTAVVAALGVAAGGGRAALRAGRLHRRARVEPWLGEHHPGDDHELVVLPTATPIAYSLDGRCPQVVVSTGLTQTLTAPQLAAVLRHEQSHLRYGHQRRLVFATAVDGALGVVPGLRASTASLRTALERWADEDASGRGPEARQCLGSALLAAAGAVPAPELAAFGGAHTVVERVAALSRPSPSCSVVARSLAWVTVGGAWLVGLTALGLWIGHTRSVLAMAGYCAS